MKPSRRNWVSLVPFGLNQQHPNNFRDILNAAWESRDNLGYAWRILRDGCCDGCALGTTGMHDWTMSGVHLCFVRLQLLRLNTMSGMDWRLLADVERLATSVNGSKPHEAGVPGASREPREKDLRQLGRLSVPMVRRKGDRGFRRVSWDEAIAVISDRLRHTDPHRIAWYLTSRGITNEAYYAHQKVARFIGTNHVDNSARLCHAPSTYALNQTIGCAATTCSYADWIGSDLIVLIGSNVANNQPVALKYLYYAKQRGTKVVLINPYFEPGLERYWIPSIARSALFGTPVADDFYQINPGGDIAFLYGALKHLIENDRVDREFVATRTLGWEAVESKARSLSWEELERGSGLSRAEMSRFGKDFGEARSAIIVWSMGVTHHRHGSDNVRAIVNLQLARGNVGRANTGLMPIRGHSGVQGGAEVGAQPGAYVMGCAVSEENAQRFAQPDYWGFAPPAWKGMNAAEMVLAAERGEIDTLWQSGGNFLDTLPEPGRVRQALGRIGLRVHQDIVVSPTMLVDPADTVVLLPSRTRYEQRGGGTETSTERRIIYSPEVPGPRPEESRDEWEIPVLVAREFDPERAAQAFPWRDTADIRVEIDRVCPTYRGIASLKEKGDFFQYGGPHLLTDRFLTPDGKGHFTAVDLPEATVPAGKFLLTTRRGRQFNSIIAEDTDPLNGARRDDVLISAHDAARLPVHTGDSILLRSEVGEYRGRAKIDRIKPGCLQGHWPEVNLLIRAGRLDASGVPDYNAIVEVIPL